MRKQVIATLLAGALVVSNASIASAAGTAPSVAGNGTGQVYAPDEIIDVVVPTDFSIAFNPMGVAINNGTLSGSDQVLSGTYAIQNRSTVPVTVTTAFTVTADTATVKWDSAEAVQADNVAATKPTFARFSLDLVTTAAGTAQTMLDPGNKADDSTAQIRTAPVPTPDAKGVVPTTKITKKSTTPISLTTLTKTYAATNVTSVDFSLAAGPYKAEYDKENDKVIYKTSTANPAFDTVAFTFSGTTSTYPDLWKAAKVQPSVKATYTLATSTTAQYNATPISPTSKGVVVKTADVVVTSGAGDKAYTFKTAPVVTWDKEDDSKVASTVKATLLSLNPGSKPDSTIPVTELGTLDKEAGTFAVSFGADYKADGAKAIAPGFYQLTIGSNKQSFIMQVK